ncbi:MAG: VOC family protein [Faecousia sp.]
MIVENLHHVAIIVSDYEKSKDFYVNKLGFEVIREEHRAAQNDIKLEVRLNNCMLEIFGKQNPGTNPGKPTQCGVWHLCFHAPDLDKTIAELNALGIKTDPIMINASNGKRIAFFYDPDGLPLELHE